MSEYEEAKKLGISDDDLGIAQPDLKEVCPDDITVAEAKVAKKEASGPLNSFPIPTGTSDRKAVLFQLIPHAKVLRFQKVYNGFINKDMPFVDFCIEMEAMTNEDLMNSDLKKMVSAHDMKRVIDAKLN